MENSSLGNGAASGFFLTDIASRGRCQASHHACPGEFPNGYKA